MFSHLRWSRLGFVADGLLGAGTQLTIFTLPKVFMWTVPSDNDPLHAVTLAIAGGKRLPRPTHPTFTDELWTLTQRCWDQEDYLRPLVSEILQILHALLVSFLGHTSLA